MPPVIQNSNCTLKTKSMLDGAGYLTPDMLTIETRQRLSSTEGWNIDPIENGVIV